MSSTTQEQLLRFFRDAVGADVSGPPAMDPAPDSSDVPLSERVSSAESTVTSETASGPGYAATPVGTSTEAGVENAQSTGGTGSTVVSALTTFLEGGLGIVPLLSSLFGLFGGGNSAPPELQKYQKPSSIDFVSADTPDGLVAADYDQLGMPRLADTAVPTQPTASSSDAGGPLAAPYGSGAAQSATVAPQVMLNIQAMDAQSILDRSSDIAQAVRSAMLNMNAINDVIGDL